MTLKSDASGRNSVTVDFLFKSNDEALVIVANCSYFSGDTTNVCWVDLEGLI